MSVRDKHFNVLMSEGERRMLQALADGEGVSPSDYFRQIVQQNYERKYSMENERGALALLLNEFERIHEWAFQLNVRAWRQLTAKSLVQIASDGPAETQVEPLLPRLFHRLAPDKALVSQLNNVRDRLSKLKAAAEQIVRQLQDGTCTDATLTGYHRLLREQMPEVLSASRNVVTQLQKLAV